ncbi:hypothetical protein JH302_01625 [Xanthomonas campestris]|uniref:hypothetical protein n=1 Tax=Xanthomonas campestris TaxID=339 RepID=UPI002379EEE8|nr:hypothetical protein [Xanthomonas campestris]WDJ90117.1 hypothetical protein JH302_01625 [Xanthomonas campestris]
MLQAQNCAPTQDDQRIGVAGTKKQRRWIERASGKPHLRWQRGDDIDIDIDIGKANTRHSRVH